MVLKIVSQKSITRQCSGLLRSLTPLCPAHRQLYSAVSCRPRSQIPRCPVHRWVWLRNNLCSNWTSWRNWNWLQKWFSLFNWRPRWIRITEKSPKMSKWAIRSKKQAICSFAHFWLATCLICSHRSFLVSNLRDSLTSLTKKEGMIKSLIFKIKKTYIKHTKT